jgi:heme-degrading monooxygenase HmoA
MTRSRRGTCCNPQPVGPVAEVTEEEWELLVTAIIDLVVIYTAGTWTVKPGQEVQFVEAWRDLATRSPQAFAGASAVLLRDRPDVFLSCGPWQSLEQVEAWRASEVFQQGLAKIRPLLEAFEPRTMDLAAGSS